MGSYRLGMGFTSTTGSNRNQTPASSVTIEDKVASSGVSYPRSSSTSVPSSSSASVWDDSLSTDSDGGVSFGGPSGEGIRIQSPNWSQINNLLNYFKRLI